MRFFIEVDGATDDDFERISQWFLDNYSYDERPDVIVQIAYESDKAAPALIWDIRRIFGDRLRHLDVIPIPRREAGGPS